MTAGAKYATVGSGHSVKCQTCAPLGFLNHVEPRGAGSACQHPPGQGHAETSTATMRHRRIPECFLCGEALCVLPYEAWTASENSTRTRPAIPEG